MRLFTVCVFLLATQPAWAQQPIALHPANSHYFLFRNKPTVLISSAEHYGAVLNLEVDYKKYLSVLQGAGFNQTRIFAGSFCEGSEYDVEKGKSFNWADIQNTLAPRPEKFIAPWARSSTPGYVRGGNKFDLDSWDSQYFIRLKEFLTEADRRGVIVEIVLFTAIYSPKLWANSPLNADNNINSIETISFNEFHLFQNKELLHRQVAMVEKIVKEVNAFDNVYFEICNEPYWLKGIPGEDSPIKEQQFLPEIESWQNAIAEAITKLEAGLPKKHLIAQNIANSNFKVTKLHPSVSILNYHYASPPACVPDNYNFARPIVYDETSQGQSAPYKRREAWAFFMAGGAGYSNLDWSFTTDDMSGLGRNPSGRRQSGKEVREQLSILTKAMNGFDFINSHPIDLSLLVNLPQNIRVYGLRSAKEIMLYFMKVRIGPVDKVMLTMPPSQFKISVIDPLSGEIIDSQTKKTNDGILSIDIPAFPDDLVLKVIRQN